MTKDEVIEFFKKYDFRDPLGHQLIDCEDFHTLAGAAATGAKIEAVPLKGTLISAEWLNGLLRIIDPAFPLGSAETSAAALLPDQQDLQSPGPGDSACIEQSRSTAPPEDHEP